MNKAELVEAMVKKSGLSKKDAEAGLNAFVDVVKKELANKKGDRKVQLVGFGTFEVAERKARTGRNPSTGETIKIKASKAPRFKAGKAFKDAVNGAKKSK
ncbi:MAG: HU family DNA-binding protein [Lachnospiraceae bacterium]|nr:HU family DNA-binding protein [Lachnospiraceae bacterium]